MESKLFASTNLQRHREAVLANLNRAEKQFGQVLICTFWTDKVESLERPFLRAMAFVQGAYANAAREALGQYRAQASDSEGLTDGGRAGTSSLSLDLPFEHEDR